jgi:DNA sulfur modification protein DndB
MEPMENVLTFTAIRGIQAGREYYTAMCPLKVISKIFLFDEEELAANLRAQRSLNKSRIPELARYIVDNPREYIFSSITASVDGKVAFEANGKDGLSRNVGRLLIPMTARFLINDGQHRRAAIEEALKERPELGEETLSVVFFVDAGLKRSQQMFADLNRHAIRPTKSLGILYDHRDPLSQLARSLIDQVDVFKNLTETEKTTISNRSNKLHTLSAIYQATQALLGKSKRGKITRDEQQLAVDFWQEVGSAMPDWQLAAQRKVSCAELRRDFIHAHGLAVQAIGMAGATLLAHEPRNWKSKLKSLQKIDWSRSNSKIWENRALVSGRVSKALVHVSLTASYVKESLGLPLSAKEKQLEAKLRKERKVAS